MVLYCIQYRWRAILQKCLASIHCLLTQVVPLSHGSNKEWAATLLSFADCVHTVQSIVDDLSDDCVVRFRLLLGIVYNTFSCSSCVRMFSGGIAGIGPVAILGSMVRHSYSWQSSKLGTFQTLQHFSICSPLWRNGLTSVFLCVSSRAPTLLLHAPDWTLQQQYMLGIWILPGSSEGFSARSLAVFFFFLSFFVAI